MIDKKDPLARKDVPKEYKWQINKIYNNEDIWQEDCQKIHDMIPNAEKYQGHLQDGVKIFLEFLQFQEELSQLIDKAYLYASMKKDEDNTVPLYQGMKEEITGLSVEAQSALSFFEPELLAMPQNILENYLKNRDVALYGKYISDITRMRTHTLDIQGEKLLAMSGEMGGAFSGIFSMLNNADMKFPQIINEDGSEVRLTHGNFINFMESTDRDVRKSAFEALYSTYEKNINTLAAIYAGSVKKDAFYARSHNYDSALAASLDQDNVPLTVYHKLIDTVKEHVPLFEKYLELKKRLLKVDELHIYDIYTPLFPESNKKYPYEDAVEIVKKALTPLGKEYIEIASKGLESGWVDIYENIGKTPGAYSSGVFGYEPYILMNYQDNLNSVFTLAHELGHSMHSYFSWRNQPYVYAYYRIFVAEVASTVNETLLVNYLLKESKTREEKLYLLNHQLEEFRGTVFRQTMFAEFEKLTHKEIEAGKSLTAEKLTEIYYNLNKIYFGDSICLDQAIGLEWARIPHFYRPFYVYKYATGFSAAQALAGAILNEDRKKAAKATELYLEFLSSGGKDDPIVLLQRAGVDMTKSDPIEAAMKIFEECLTSIEELV